MVSRWAEEEEKKYVVFTTVVNNKYLYIGKIIMANDDILYYTAVVYYIILYIGDYFNSKIHKILITDYPRKYNLNVLKRYCFKQNFKPFKNKVFGKTIISYNFLRFE